jgi:tetratricopeptide (TPR) repeat protein
MKRFLVLICVCGIVGLATGSKVQAQGQDKVSYYDRAAKPDKKGNFPVIELSGKIDAESPSGVTVTPRGGKGKDVPAADIKDIHYDTQIIGISTIKTKYNLAFKSEQDALAATGDKRYKLLTDPKEGALPNYQEVLADRAKFPKPLIRHVEFKVPMLMLAAYGSDKKREAEALKLLLAFRDAHRDSWQIGACLEKLGDLQMASEDYKSAVKTFDEILAMRDLSDENKAKYRLLAADALVKGKEFATAQTRLDAILKTMKPTDAQYFPLQMRLMKCKASTPTGVDGAIKDLEKIIKDTKEDDKYKKAVAHNTLGDCYLMNNKPGDAIYEYLYVDVWYNVDPGELAKAYSELIKIYEKFNKPARVKEYQEKLSKLKGR